MKKSLTSTLLFASVLALSILACQTNETPTPQLSAPDALGLSVKKGRLVFSSVEAYRRVVDDATLETKTRFTEAANSLRDFTSLYEKHERQARAGADAKDDGQLIKDDYFKQILNPDLVVQIGANLFRIDPKAEKAYVLAAARESQYADLLAGNTSNPNIRQFSTKDDVLELMRDDDGDENGNVGIAAPPLTCYAVSYPNTISGVTSPVLVGGTQVEFTYNVGYVYSAIYFSLYTDMACKTVVGKIPFPADMKMTYSGYIAKRCKPKDKPFSGMKMNPSGGPSLSYSPYTSTNNLQHYYLTVSFDRKNPPAVNLGNFTIYE